METFPQVLRRAERHFLSREAVAGDGLRISFEQQLDRVRRVASVLDDLGLESGSRVAVLSANSVPYVDLYLGVPSSGRVFVPLNFRWAEPELGYAIRDSKSTLLVCDRDPGGLANLVNHVVRTNTGEYDELIAAAGPGTFARNLTGSTLAEILYTGGTTGESKGVMLSHANLVANAIAMQLTVPYDAADVFLVTAPLFHAAGSFSLLQCALVGARQVVVPFDPATVLDVVERERATITAAVPTMIAALAEEQNARPRDVTSLRLITHGGSPMATELIRRASDVFPNAELFHVYGATECSPVITGLRNEQDHLGTPRELSAGIAPIGSEIAIRDADGNVVDDGTAGEVTVRGPHVMLGYWEKPNLTSEVLRDGWYHTGDIGRVDDEGYLYLLDRAKDMIISGGENVYCGEVEETLYRHPAVLEAAVFGIPDERWGESVHAVVVPREEVSADELIAHCRSLIAGYKVPRSVEIRHEPLPKSGPGKVLKRELRASRIGEPRSSTAGGPDS